MNTNLSDDALIAAFREAGQGHVLRWWDELAAASREKLLGQLRQIDLDEVGRLAVLAASGGFKEPLSGTPSLPDYVRLPENAADDAARRAAAQKGQELLRAGKVGVLTVAGGQGTRLGYDAPKGTYPIGAVSGKSIFQIHAERILATGRRYGRALPWYIMTSDTTDAATRRFFEENRFFGLAQDDVVFFTQRMLPALDRNLKLVLVAKDEILLSPNGHGGTLLACHECGLLDDMERRGVEEISYIQVDNPLVPAADPVFIGAHALAGAQMSSKTIWKRDPEEPIGAFVQLGGRTIVREYSDLSREQTHERTESGALLYGLGSIAIHMLRVDFIRRETRGGFRLPYHVAEKSSSFVDDSGRIVKPEKKNVYKFETFIFDALRDAERSVILEMRRREEFSPVKNAAGVDSPESCRRDMSALYAGWLSQAGIEVLHDDQGLPLHPVEISPLYALDAEELVARAPGPLRLNGPIYLAPPKE